MLTIRSIAPAELPGWARLFDRSPERTHASIAAQWESGDGRPELTLIAEQDGRPLARVAVVSDTVGCGLATREHTVVALAFDGGPGVREAVLALLGEAVARAIGDAGTTLDVRVNPARSDAVDFRLDLFRELGFEEFQRKEGFLWRADGQSSPPSVGRPRLSYHSIEETGRAALTAVMARAGEGTLDRVDRHYQRLCGRDAWAAEMLGYLEEADAPDWLLATTAAGEAVGYVLLGTFEPPARGTIVHIGVVPEQRGNGYVDDLLAELNRRARRRGFGEVLSDVDTANTPMLRAMARAGHRADDTPWHVWHLRLDLVARG